ncbi:MAG: hypothetical protein J07HQX50_01234 [Haloquadratum sp. J07HQX50]|nr:MAG: hypothetical protein J07HQX50_01234 [Haloquadratum sp. J07HQX50]
MVPKFKNQVFSVWSCLSRVLSVRVERIDFMIDVETQLSIIVSETKGSMSVSMLSVVMHI